MPSRLSLSRVAPSLRRSCSCAAPRCHGTPAQCVAVYRAAYLAGDWSFRLCRVYDVFAAADRAAFVVATADGMRAHFDLATQWACFTLGWLVGFMQPSSPPAWRICYFILATASPLVPAFMGWLVSSRFDWLQIGLRVLLLPQVVGFTLEELQRCLVKKVLSSTIRNELAIALPSAPLASARRKRVLAKEGSRRRLATLPEKGEEVEDDGEDGPFAGLAGNFRTSGGARLRQLGAGAADARRRRRRRASRRQEHL
jgi:hypothetical protein